MTPQERARRFVEDVLIPLEEKAERAAGRLPDSDVARIRSAAVEAGLAGGLHAREHGGQGWTKMEWVLVEEQFGRSTNALSWHVPTAYNVLASGSDPQIERYLKPALRGELQDAYAVTEAGRGVRPLAGSRPPPCGATAAGSSTARSGSSRPATWRPSTSWWR